jgi:enoyl-CoA hydratase
LRWKLLFLLQSTLKNSTMNLTRSPSDTPAAKPWRCIEVQRDGAVEWLTLARPDNFNALNLALTQELYDYFGNLPDRQDVRVVVMRGAGKHFCAGYDLQDMEQLTTSLEQGLYLQRQLSGVVLRMRRCPQPVVGLLQGASSGGGFALAHRHWLA